MEMMENHREAMEVLARARDLAERTEGHESAPEYHSALNLLFHALAKTGELDLDESPEMAVEKFDRALEPKVMHDPCPSKAARIWLLPHCRRFLKFSP